MVVNYNSGLDTNARVRNRTIIHIQDGVQWIRGDLADLSIKDNFQHIHDYVGLGSLACAGIVGLNQAKKCLNDTRTKNQNKAGSTTATATFGSTGMLEKGKRKS